MAGNYGPLDKMGTAIAAATPNVPWARFGCPKIIDLNGAGTSAATPQVAAAAANWIQKNMAALQSYPFPWMRVEAVRKALFDGAQRHNDDILHLGTGQLRAAHSCALAPAAAQSLKKQAPDTADHPFLNTLLGANFGIAPSRQTAMLQLEALQLSQRSEVEKEIHAAQETAFAKPLEEAVRDALQGNPGLSVDEALRQAGAGAGKTSAAALGRVRDALLAQPDMSKALRAQLGAPSRLGPGADQIRGRAGTASATDPSIQKIQIDQAKDPKPPTPLRRLLRVFAYDPSLAATLDTAEINTAIAEVRWETRAQAGANRRICRSDRRRSGKRLLLCPRGSQPSSHPRDERSGAVGGQSAVSSTNVLRDRDAHDRMFRERAGPLRAMGPAFSHLPFG